MIRKLGEIAEIQSGYPFRKSVRHHSRGNYAVVQVRDIRDDTTICYEHLARVSDIQPKKRHFLREGDLLFSAKGSHNLVGYVEKNLQNTVASANFFVIRVKSQYVLPEYLAWYMTQRTARKFFRAHAKGTLTLSISKAVLRQLQIPIPSLEKQRKILKMQLMANEELKIALQILTKRTQMIQAILLKAAKEHLE
ncbi:MAG: hypothetical protein D6814_03345 [Calditrichaeota bacterium]|nr:MAG: hypothetical protein D6814_03345 [Calditrichota bacterium]